MEINTLVNKEVVKRKRLLVGVGAARRGLP
jgi:hypothetical protein